MLRQSVVIVMVVALPPYALAQVKSGVRSGLQSGVRSGYDYRYEYKKIHQLPLNTFSDDWSIEVFVRFPHGESVSIGDFKNFKSGYAANGQQYMVGQISYSKLREWSENENIGIILAPGANFISENNIKQVDEVTYAVA